jgi:hypothetical protein
MIPIFRKIRHNLLRENKFKRYLIYAIGEIILVVIGILIALSINNWNENKKTQEFEITILKNIQEDILADKIDLALNLQYHKEMVKNEQLLLNFLLNDQTQNSNNIEFTTALGIDLITAFHNASFNNLQNNDIGLINNNRLYKKITRFYDFYSTAIIQMENEHDYSNTYDEKFPYFKKHFTLADKKSSIHLKSDMPQDTWNQDFERYNFSIKNLDLLKADEEFRIVLSESLFIGSVKIDFYNQILEKIEELNNEIKDELILLEK